MIRVEKLNKSFGSLQVLRDIDLSIERGEVVSIVGASGAGKTTLLQLLGTLLRPDSGHIFYDDMWASCSSSTTCCLSSQPWRMSACPHSLPGAPWKRPLPKP